MAAAQGVAGARGVARVVGVAARIGPLVGVTFISAVRTYAEASGLNGTAVGVGEAFSPLVGIWAPTFSACEVAAVFLLPFVAIRLVAGDRQSGALKIELQHPMPADRAHRGQGARAVRRLADRVAGAGRRGGAVEQLRRHASIAPELATVALGHLLNAGLTIALAAAAAAMTEHPSTAAILTLSVTVGTWISTSSPRCRAALGAAAGYTPPAMIAGFQHGLIRLDVVLVARRARRRRASRWPPSGCASACRCGGAAPKRSRSARLPRRIGLRLQLRDAELGHV